MADQPDEARASETAVPDAGAAAATGTGAAAASRSLAAKVDHLFATVHPARGEYSYEHVATAIRDAGGPTISAAYVWMLRKGQRDNPTMKHLEALAGFFGVPAAYFFDDVVAERVDQQLRVVAALRDTQVRKMALRATGLSSESLATIAEMIERVRKLEGLPDDPTPPVEGDSST